MFHVLCIVSYFPQLKIPIFHILPILFGCSSVHFFCLFCSSFQFDSAFEMCTNLALLLHSFHLSPNCLCGSRLGSALANNKDNAFCIVKRKTSVIWWRQSIHFMIIMAHNVEHTNANVLQHIPPERTFSRMKEIIQNQQISNLIQWQVATTVSVYHRRYYIYLYNMYQIVCSTGATANDVYASEYRYQFVYIFIWKLCSKMYTRYETGQDRNVNTIFHLSSEFIFTTVWFTYHLLLLIRSVFRRPFTW